MSRSKELEEGGYETVARQSMINDEPANSPVIQFGASLFELADDLASLEAKVSEHELSAYGIGKNGLDDLNDQYRSLIARFTAAQKVVSDPGSQLSEYEHVDGEVTSDDATRLRTEIHTHNSFDLVLDQIRETQNRIGSDISSKRAHNTTMRGLLISMVSSVVAVISLVISVGTYL